MSNLLVLFLVPLICSTIIFIFSPLPNRYIKTAAFLLSLLPLLMLVGGYPTWLGKEINYPWFSAISLDFHLKVDSLSLVFLYLTTIIIPISLLATRSATLSHPTFFYGLVLLLQALLIGFFTARNLVLFTIFWESMLLPLYFIIALWGGSFRQSAALKFLIYMLAGSFLMVAAILSLYFSNGAGTFDLDSLATTSAAMPHAALVCAIFLVAFAVKTPLFPFHAWLPDAYCQAPTGGTILLAGLLSKAGIYGIIRIIMELFPQILREWSPLLLGLAIAGVLYGGLAAWMQKDYKRLLAYSSFSHVNFILAGLFIWNQTAHEGAILQAFNHGVTITALFLAAGWLEERLRTTSMGQYSGMAKFLPHLCWLTLFFVLSSVALPGTNNFIGELLILFGLFGISPWLALTLGLTVILSVIYMLRWMQKVYFETPHAPYEPLTDIKWKEFAIALPLVALILWIGVYPSPALNLIAPATEKNISPAKLEASR